MAGGLSIAVPIVGSAAPPFTFADGDTITAEPFNAMFTELYDRMDAIEADVSNIEEVPAGTIVMWSGSLETIPPGWQLCDGSMGSPDLTDRFIVGAGASYAYGDMGGEDEVTLSVGELPSHDHSFTYTRPVYQPGFLLAGWPAGPALTEHAAEGLSTAAAGGNQPHENRPPYFALAFIIRL